MSTTPSDPQPFSAELRKLNSANPVQDAYRWAEARSDAEQFMKEWGTQAAELGWRPEELFGLHATSPLSRFDQMGLVWILRGRPVVELTGEFARLPSGGTIYRKQN